MDPNECLKQIRQLVRAYQAAMPESPQEMEAAGLLAEHVEALDEWLSKGGFAPDAWKQLADERRAGLDSEKHCCDCGAGLSVENESSGLEEGSDGVPVVVPLCEQCSSARDYRAGCR